jgi:hypothetical protein
MRLKQAAVARLGVEGAFAACRGALGVPGLDRLALRPLRALGAAAAAAPRYHLAWPGGARFDRPMPRVLGDGNHASMPGRERAGYLCRLDDAQVRGRSSLVLHEGVLLLDAEGDEFAALPDNPGYDPGILHAVPGAFWSMEADPPPLHVEEAFLLGGNHSVDFGHWMTEYLPRYALAVESGLPPGTPMLLDAIVPQTVVAALSRLLPPGTPVIRLPHLGMARVDRLWCASNPVYTGFYPTQWNDDTWSMIASAPRTLAIQLRALVALFGPDVEAPTGFDRVYLARKPSRWKKRLLDHVDIEEAARARGFRVVYPEDLDLHEQVRLVRNATHIVAPEGSNALLAWFARPGARLLLLSPPYTLPLVDVNAILAALGVDATVLTGPDEPTQTDFSAYWNDYRIGAERFAAVLDAWLAP